MLITLRWFLPIRYSIPCLFSEVSGDLWGLSQNVTKLVFSSTSAFKRWHSGLKILSALFIFSEYWDVSQRLHFYLYCCIVIILFWFKFFCLQYLDQFAFIEDVVCSFRPFLFLSFGIIRNYSLNTYVSIYILILLHCQYVWDLSFYSLIFWPICFYLRWDMTANETTLYIQDTICKNKPSIV